MATQSDFRVKKGLIVGTTDTANPESGTFTYDADFETVDLTLDANVNARLAQDHYFYVKAGATITKGDVVYASGAVGNSGKIEATPYIANNTIDESLVLGVAAEDIATGAFGYVSQFGSIRGLDASGGLTTGGESWTDGSILYASPTYAGELTLTKPSAPNQDIPIAFVISNNGSNGVIAVRASRLGYHMDEVHDVEITSIADKDLLVYNNANSRWENGKTIGDLTLTGELNGPATFYIDPAPHDPDTDGDTNGLVVIRGDLQVDGTTTTINSTTVNIDDKNIILADGASTNTEASGGGITIAGSSAQLTYDGVQDRWNMNKGLELLSVPLVVGTGSTDVGRIENDAGVFSMTAYTGRQIAFGNDTNGEHVRIDADGQVGIGTDDPSLRLDVATSSGAAGSFNRHLMLSRGTSVGAAIGTYRAATSNDVDRMSLGIGSAATLIVSDLGRVGINQASPNQQLEVNGQITSVGFGLPNSGSAGWYKLGTLTDFVQGGRSVKFRFVMHSGYNASDTQDYDVELYMKTSNGGSTNAAGGLYNSWTISRGYSGAQAEFKWKDIGGDDYELYMMVPAFALGSYYTIEKSHGRWVVAATTATDPGADSATVLEPTARGQNLLRAYRGHGFGQTQPYVDQDGIQINGDSSDYSTWTARIVGRNNSKNGVHIEVGANSNQRPLRIRNHDSTQELFTVRADGTVGVGTDTPSNPLQVLNSGTTATVKIENSSGQSTEGACLILDASGRGTGVVDIDIFKIENFNGDLFGINNAGDLIPYTSTQDLGSTANPWQNIYTQDLNLSNEKRDEGNSVDGTKGNWTIQEGDEHLYIINNKSGKKYRFALEEIE